MERQRPRKNATKTLCKISERVAQQQECEAEATLSGYRRHYKLRAEALWVVGSYARGAPFCTDLDIILELNILKGGFPPTPMAARCIYGRFPDVQLFLGNPMTNTANQHFTDARLIWSPQQPDWKENITSIAIDPHAGRFKRPHDSLPIRKHQTRNSFEDLDELLQLLSLDIIRSNWTPLESIKPNPQAWTKEAHSFHEKALRCNGSRNRKILPFLIEKLRRDNITDSWTTWFIDNNTFKIGSTLAIIGKPLIRVDMLNSLQYASIALFPHITRRGPNGIWTITRGPNHPVSQQFHRCHAYVIKDGDHYLTTSDIGNPADIKSIGIFARKPNAIGFIKEMHNGRIPRGMTIERIDDTAILKILATVDAADIFATDSAERYTMTEDGRIFDWYQKIPSKIAAPANMARVLRQIPPDKGETTPT